MLLCERSVLSRADGSAQWTQGGTSVMAAVYGPRRAPAHKEDATRAVVEVTFRPWSGIAGSKEVTYESHIQKLLEGVIVTGLHPRTSISVVLQVAHEDGSVLACALNAACAALLDAAIPLKHLFAAASCAVLASGSTVVDPDAATEEASRAMVCAAYGHHRERREDSTDGEMDIVVADTVLTCLAIGVLETEALFGALDVCRGCCINLASFSIRSLQRSLEFKV